MTFVLSMPARLGGRGPGRHLAHRRRRPAVAAAALRHRLPALVDLLSRRAAGLGGRRLRAPLHPSEHRRALTRDGGRTWDRDPNLVLPALRRIGFFDPRHGWAAGCRSAMYPSGAFLTEDGGRSWRPLGGDSPAGWPAATSLAPRRLAGRAQRPVAVRPQWPNGSGPHRRV